MRKTEGEHHRTWLLRLAPAGLAVAGLLIAGGPAARADGGTSHPEQESNPNGVNTFTDYHNASGEGPHIDAGATVGVSCKVLDGTIKSVNPDGYWYRIADSPWDGNYYAAANTFLNGDPAGGPYSHNTDYGVPDCDAPPSAPTPAPVTAAPVVPHDPRPTGTIGRPRNVPGQPKRAKGRAPTFENPLQASFQALIDACGVRQFHLCYNYGEHYLDRSGTDAHPDLASLLAHYPRLRAFEQGHLQRNVAAADAKLAGLPATASRTVPVDTGWKVFGFGSSGMTDAHYALGSSSLRVVGDLWEGPAAADGSRPVQLRYRTFLNDIYDFTPGQPYGEFQALVGQNRASEFWIYGDTPTQVSTAGASTFQPSRLTLKY